MRPVALWHGENVCKMLYCGQKVERPRNLESVTKSIRLVSILVRSGGAGFRASPVELQLFQREYSPQSAEGPKNELRHRLVRLSLEESRYELGHVQGDIEPDAARELLYR